MHPPSDGRIWHYMRHMQPPVGYHLIVQPLPAPGTEAITCEAHSAEICSIGPQQYHETVVMIGRVPHYPDQILCWSFFDQKNERAIMGEQREPTESSELTQVWLRQFHSSDLDQVEGALRAASDFLNVRLKEVTTPAENCLRLNLHVPITVEMLPTGPLQDIRETMLTGLIELFKKANER